MSIDNLNIEKEKVVLYQMNPENPDPKKINGCSLGIFDGLALKDKTIVKVLKSMKKLMTKKAKLIIIHTDNRNRIGAEDFKNIVDEIELI